MTAQIRDTGERVIPEFVAADDVMATVLLEQHLARYRQACDELNGGHVVDAGCGVGYGSALLAKACDRVTAVDTSDEAIAFAREHYAADNVSYVVCDLGDGLREIDQPVDAVVCFEVLEHVQDPAATLRSFRNVLGSSGQLFISGTTYSTRDLYKYHLHDYTRESFRAQLLAAGFEVLDECVQSAEVSASDVRRVMLRHSASFPGKRLMRHPVRVLRALWRSHVSEGLNHVDVMFVCSVARDE